MPRSTIKNPLTQCGLYGNRAQAAGRDGNRITYRWPCGFERTEVMMQGVGKLRQPMAPDVVAFFARYWAQGVTYECPRCRREAAKKK